MLENKSAVLDYFEDFYSYNSYNPHTVLVFMIGIFSGILGPISVIWYERNCGNRFRTVLNQLFATEAWYILFYTLLIYIPDGLRFVIGPFDDLFCDIHVVFQNTMWHCILLTADLMIILRYLFVFRIKNFAIIDDDLLAMSINLSIPIISIWIAIVRRFTPGRLPLYYYLCSGLDPNEGNGNGSYLAKFPKYNVGRIVVVVSFFLHLVMLPRFLHYQLVTRRKDQPVRLGNLEANQSLDSYNKGIRCINRARGTRLRDEHKTLFGLISQFTLLMCLLAFGFAIKSGIGIEPMRFNEEKNHWIPLSMLIYGPVAASSSCIIIVFVKNAQLRQKIWQGTKKLCNKEPT